uniref:Toxin candidate TRINITY_DN28326_c0_g1_i3.p1 n=1 Tax=Pachycerianthus borealis TaxID=2736680 RepID=A0A7G7WYV0_9CNID|nr:toxin candidate TRINITY_DN28326_c0_g1_i3.p1 [Pachycerianthus borealis]
MKTVYMVLLLAMMILQVEGCCQCKYGEVSFGRHCYQIRYYTTTSWQQAGQNCANSGGDLASILSPGEQHVIKRRVNTINLFYGWKPFWIGANDVTTEGTITWSDGSIYSYTRLGNTNSGPSDCMYFHSNGYWYIISCSYSSARYICKRECRCV